MSVTLPRSVLGPLEQAGIDFELVMHERTTSALAEARALGLDPSCVAKTVVLVTPDRFVRTVLPASERLDLEKVRRVVGAVDIALATEEALAGAYPDVELGALPPLGGSTGDAVVVDSRLCDREWVFVEAGVHDCSLRLRVQDLLLLTDARVADVCRDGPLAGGQKGGSLRRRHVELEMRSDLVARAARSLPELSPPEREAVRRDVLRFLRNEVAPHLAEDESLLYPVVSERLADPLATAPLRYEHRAIRWWMEEIAHVDVEDWDLLQQLLYGIHALVKVHLSREEDIYVGALESKSWPSTP